MHAAEYQLLLDPYHQADYLESALLPEEQYGRTKRARYAIKLHNRNPKPQA
jgi:hypothetical protein